jgi:ADP-ribose pyrophosphatase YjhB (NUDIX family)
MPTLRSDIVDVYIVRGVEPGAGTARPEILQMRRADSPLLGTWQPLMGHVEAGETALNAAWRELQEEVGLSRSDASLLEFLALEQVHPFFLAELDAIVLSPRFCAIVANEWAPRLSEEHSAFRWVVPTQIEAMFMWPGQRAACAEIISILTPGNTSREHLRLK